MKKRKKILIIFPDAHLAYSPTVLQLSEELNKFFACYIFCFENNNYHKLNESNIIYGKRLFGLGKLFIFFKYIFPSAFTFDANFYYKKFQLLLHLIFYKYNEFIYVDPISIMLAGSHYKKGTLLSLELTKNTTEYLQFLKKKISYLIIQNKTRKDIYFAELKCETFYIQNAPNFNLQQLENYRAKKKNQLVFGGTAALGFGIEACLNFVKKYNEYKLIIKGSIPDSVYDLIKIKHKNELKNQSVILKKGYQENDQYLIDLSENYIGFAFYDLDQKEINNINYITGPSGKMFKYFAAGVPVICSNLQGFDPVKEFNAGILIDDLKAESIFEAITKIAGNYNYYQQNCYFAAEHYSFQRSVSPFIKILKTNASEMK